MIDAALALADTKGIDAVTLRAVAERLGVEAMSLYKHVANKDAILDGLVERVVDEMALPDPGLPIDAYLRARAHTVRRVLLRHPWAAALVESRATPTPSRLRMNDALVGALLAAGFSVALAYGTQLAFDAYVYGFALQETVAPCAAEGLGALIEDLRPAIPAASYPHLATMMGFVAARAEHEGDTATRDFDFGLDLLLGGLERARRDRAPDGEPSSLRT